MERLIGLPLRCSPVQSNARVRWGHDQPLILIVPPVEQFATVFVN